MSTLLEQHRKLAFRLKAGDAMKSPEELAHELNMENVRTAGNLLGHYFARFADKISDAERNDFFHPCNRDLWTRKFARFLEQQIDSDFPSND